MTPKPRPDLGLQHGPTQECTMVTSCSGSGCKPDSSGAGSGSNGGFNDSRKHAAHHAHNSGKGMGCNGICRGCTLTKSGAADLSAADRMTWQRRTRAAPFHTPCSPPGARFGYRPGSSGADCKDPTAEQYTVRLQKEVRGHDLARGENAVAELTAITPLSLSTSPPSTK